MPTDGSPFVLFANLWLAGRSGTEVVTRDYALGLAQRGWRVAIYAPQVGQTASEVAGRVEVTSDLASITGEPDLIVGAQHPALVPAMVRFPRSPALQVCHDLVAWHDAALTLERVRRHAGVDAACRERVVAETGLDPADIPLLPNTIDLDRCKPRPPLPDRPRRVLVVANRHGDHVAAVLEACRAAGLQAEAVGYGVGRPSFTLEADMAQADIVVGAARIALEAMAVGAAALVCDIRGIAGMVRSERFDAWRTWNFGWRLLTSEVTVAAVREALDAYDPQDAARVSARVRAECGVDSGVERVEGLCRTVIAEHAALPPVDGAREARDLAAYLTAWLPIDLRFGPFAQDITDLRRAEAVAKTKLEGLLAELARRGMNVEFKGS